MGNLLDVAIAAHGGMDRWLGVTEVRAHLAIGGGIWALKGWPDVFADTHVTVDPVVQRVTYAPFVETDRHSLYEADRVAVVRNDGRVIEERTGAREAFDGHSLMTPWDALHLVYFSGYAIWTYLTVPFVLTLPGFSTEEIEPWNEDGDLWRRLKVTFPDHIHSHTREQIFYFDKDGLLRRHDYSLDILGGGRPSAHYVSDHKTFGGIVFPTSRRVYATDEQGRPMRGRIPVSIDIHSIELV